MKVRSLSFNDDPEGKAVLYACGVCGQCYSPKAIGVKNTIEVAEQCCAPKHCRNCGIEVEKYRALCVSCNERAKLTRAAAIPEAEWTCPVEFDGLPGGWGEGYFSDTDDLRQSCEDYDVPVPAYCWPCTSRPLRLDPDSLLERAVDDMHEDAADQIVDADGLCEFIEAWNAKQTCHTWYPDYSRVVVLDDARFHALIAHQEMETTA